MYDSRGASGSAPPLEFDTGVDAVPEAVDMCIRLMTPQELASVRSAPEFAYQGRSDVPAVRPGHTRATAWWPESLLGGPGPASPCFQRDGKSEG